MYGKLIRGGTQGALWRRNAAGSGVSGCEQIWTSASDHPLSHLPRERDGQAHDSEGWTREAQSPHV